MKRGLDRRAEGKVYGGRETHLPTPTLPPSPPPFLPFSLQERFLPLEVLPFTVLPTIHSAALTLCRVSSLEGFSNQDHSGLAVCRRYSGCPLLGALEGHQVEGEQGCQRLRNWMNSKLLRRPCP